MSKKYKSTVLLNGVLYEMVYDSENQFTQFIAIKEGEIIKVNTLTLNDQEISPYPPHNDMVDKRVVLFASDAEGYDDQAALIKNIRSFIYKYLQVSPFFENILPYYILLTWVYDAFSEIPYLRAIGDTGCGKSRFLKIVGSLCYKPTFTVGATTTAPIFRLIDEFKGTLILDEADLRFSDTNVDIIKILNTGFQKNIPVLRCADAQGNYAVKSFDVFCPKIIATRNQFYDKALESRFIIERMDGLLSRNDIATNLDEKFDQEALHLRNKCLMWRLQNYKRIRPRTDFKIPDIEPRLNQIVVPLLSIIDDLEVERELIEYIRNYNKDLIDDRGQSFEATLLEVIIRLMENNDAQVIMKDIADEYNNTILERAEKPFTPRKIGGIIRDKFMFKKERSRTGFYLVRESYMAHIDRLCHKYGITREHVNDVNVKKDELDIFE